MTRARIVVSRALPEPALELLAEAGELWAWREEPPLAPAELHEAVAGADAAVTMVDDAVDEAFLDAAGERLRVVANTAVGYDNIDVRACAARGVLVTNTPGVLTDATADVAAALVLMTTRRLGEGERLIRARTPWSWSMSFHLGTSIQGKVLGVVGLGRIGRATAERARAFGMTIAYCGRRRAEPSIERGLSATYLPLQELLASADVVSLHCPSTPETERLIDEKALATMKPSAFLVNTARGAIVDEDALVRALEDGTIAGAGLDVYAHEPDVHPGLLSLENVVLLPHLGSATVEARTGMALLAAQNVVAVLAGQAPPTPVAPPVAATAVAP